MPPQFSAKIEALPALDPKGAEAMSSSPRAPSRSAASRIGLPIPLLALVIIGCAGTPAPAQPAESGAAGQVAPEFPREDAALIAWIEAQIDSIGDVRKIAGKEGIARAHRTLEEGIVAAEYHLEHFPESPRRARAELLLARQLFLVMDRRIAEMDAANQRDFGVKLTPEERSAIQEALDRRIVGLVEAGIAREADPATQGLLHELRGELHIRRGRPLEAATEYERAIGLYPDHPHLDALLIKLGEARLWAGEYSQALRVYLDALEGQPRSVYWPHYFWFAHKCLRHTGRIEEAMAHWEKHLPGLRARAEGEPIAIPGAEEPFVTPPDYRIDAKRYVDRAGFYKGFFLYALGEFTAARDALRSYSDSLHARLSAGETLGMDTLVYLNDQADPMERRISLFSGVPAPDLGSSVQWIVPPAVEPDTPVVRLRLFCFASYARDRYAGLIRVLSRLGREYSPRGLRVEWLGVAIVPKMVERETQELGEVARALGIECALGVDAGPENSAHNAFQVTTGNVVLFVIDAKGEIAWHLIDPLDVDEGLIRRVLERVLPPAAPAGGGKPAPAGNAPPEPAKPAEPAAGGGGGR